MRRSGAPLFLGALPAPSMLLSHKDPSKWGLEVDKALWSPGGQCMGLSRPGSEDGQRKHSITRSLNLISWFF